MHKQHYHGEVHGCGRERQYRIPSRLVAQFNAKELSVLSVLIIDEWHDFKAAYDLKHKD